MTLYIRCTTDALELPMAVADSVQELSRMTGRTVGTIYTQISKKRPGWKKVEIEEDEII